MLLITVTHRSSFQEMILKSTSRLVQKKDLIIYSRDYLNYMKLCIVSALSLHKGT